MGISMGWGIYNVSINDVVFLYKSSILIGKFLFLGISLFCVLFYLFWVGVCVLGKES